MNDIWVRIDIMSFHSAQLPYKDFTIKAKLPDAKEVEKILNTAGATFVGHDFQTDHYFETIRGKLKWRQGTIENLITHYERIYDSGIERTIVYRYDLNPTKSQIEELQQNKRLIGLIKKERRIYTLANVKIHLDRLSNAEEFVEIEAIDREGKFTADELKDQCLRIKSMLRIAERDLIPTGYLKNETKI